MLPNICRFCEHGNPEGAKFCTECGGCLHLLPCPSCGAVTDVTASTCYQCQAALPWHNEGAVAAAPAVVDVAQPAARRRAPVIAGVAVLAIVVAALGYYGYRHRSLVDASTPAAAGGVSRAARQPVEAPQAKAVMLPAAEGGVSKAGSVSERAPPPGAGCTAEAAALGTCVPQSIPMKGAAATAARDARSQVIDAVKSAAIEPPRPEGCAESVAALGLCGAVTKPTPAVTHTKE
jgi:hypothetical protein